MNLSNIKVNGIELKIEKIYEQLGITYDRFLELLDRDFFIPTLDETPTTDTRTYIDEDGSECEFRVGQMCRVADDTAIEKYSLYILYDLTEAAATWVKITLGNEIYIGDTEPIGKESVWFDTSE